MNEQGKPAEIVNAYAASHMIKTAFVDPVCLKVAYLVIEFEALLFTFSTISLPRSVLGRTTYSITGSLDRELFTHANTQKNYIKDKSKSSCII